jgi:hypothetical protein
LVEDISFTNVFKEGVRNSKKHISFTVDKARLDDNTLEFFDEFRSGKSSVRDSEMLATKAGHSLSGIALWPRLILDETTVVDSRRYGDGASQRSHWQTVLPIMANRPIEGLVGGEPVVITIDFRLPVNVNEAPLYTITGQVRPSHIA